MVIKCLFVECKVYGINHLLVACMKVINREESGKKFISGDMNREIIYSLSPTKNLKEALNLFSAKADCSFVLLVSLDSGDAIKSFIEENHLHEEERDDVLSKVKPEAKKNSIIEHFGITENELSFYSLPDLVQMGVAMKNNGRIESSTGEETAADRFNASRATLEEKVAIAKKIEIQGDLNALRRELENLDPNSVHTTVTEQRIESSYLSI
ncbi:hypothetical protein JH06_1727 [Blastocystis sp. subtype 4]|uniref:hypothetical protein n=1 Tax=Blastocystis sp. subtype 4 TaxID=944170 RepID=UPI000711C227|nr:hypothetical protein JH06_1727 [Blastocystis sp. subtype 4]KNB46459.1 hypothetical protein JH06_1727 [Blastocystis sp. subtype 4]|eukprot:XP_014529933.1 hypothetical protein JH06_1727 [Blastocystis sp. subtype 4]